MVAAVILAAVVRFAGLGSDPLDAAEASQSVAAWWTVEAAERGALAAHASTGERPPARSRRRGVLADRLGERPVGSLDPGARGNRAGRARARSAARGVARGGSPGGDPARGRSLAGRGVAARQRSDPRRRCARSPAICCCAGSRPRRRPPRSPPPRAASGCWWAASAGLLLVSGSSCLGLPAADRAGHADGQPRPTPARLAATERRRDARRRRHRRGVGIDHRPPAVARSRAAVVEPRVVALVLDRLVARDVARERRARERGRGALPDRPRGARGVGVVAHLEPRPAE